MEVENGNHLFEVILRLKQKYWLHINENFVVFEGRSTGVPRPVTDILMNRITVPF